MTELLEYMFFFFLNEQAQVNTSMLLKQTGCHQLSAYFKMNIAEPVVKRLIANVFFEL